MVDAFDQAAERGRMIGPASEVTGVRARVPAGRQRGCGSTVMTSEPTHRLCPSSFSTHMGVRE
jgi:hypothetical protein